MKRIWQRVLDERRGSLLVRRGTGGRRREVGMDAWGWEQLEPWLDMRRAFPVGPLVRVINGATRGRHWSAAAAQRRDHRDRARPTRADDPRQPLAAPLTDRVAQTCWSRTGESSTNRQPYLRQCPRR
jgi:hypothetical protein